MNNFNLAIIAILIYATSACVPARKFEEIAEKQEVCAKDLKALKTLKTELETENTELQSISDRLSEE